jgi:hypothetical protein
MKNLKYYIGGIATIIFMVPVINKFTELVEVWIESLKATPSKRILEHEKDTALLREFLNEPEEMYDYEVEYLNEDDDE